MNSYIEAPGKITSAYILRFSNPNSGNVSYRHASHMFEVTYVWGYLLQH